MFVPQPRSTVRHRGHQSRLHQWRQRVCETYIADPPYIPYTTTRLHKFCCRQRVETDTLAGRYTLSQKEISKATLMQTRERAVMSVRPDVSSLSSPAVFLVNGFGARRTGFPFRWNDDSRMQMKPSRGAPIFDIIFAAARSPLSSTRLGTNGADFEIGTVGDGSCRWRRFERG